MNIKNGFKNLKSRTIILWHLPYIAIWFILDIFILPKEKTSGLIGQIFFYIVPLLWIGVNFKKYNIKTKSILGKRPKKYNWWPAFGLVLTHIVFAVSIIFTFWFAISYILPDKISETLNVIPDISPELESGFGYAILDVLVGPIIEELFFRGILLNRWTEKKNIRTAILLSSALFGLLHGIGFVSSFIFGLFMSILYIKSGTIFVPIICHIINNMTSQIFELIPIEGYISDATIPSLINFPISHFRLPLFIAGVIPFLITLIITLRFVYKNWPSKTGKSPYMSNLLNL